MESGGELIRGDEENIYVSVRLRPLNDKEISNDDVSDWDCISNDTVLYKNVGSPSSERSMYPNAYTFDKVFRTDCSTREVYEHGVKDVAISVVHGINSTIFAYGQTSSGKTYTMTGITEYAIADVYEYIDQHPERDFVLKFSAMEIYNENIRDLLSSDSTPLRVFDDPERGTVVEKLTEEILKDKDHAIDLLSICGAQRQTGETALNEMSSRSHQIIRLTIESTSREFLGRDHANVLTAFVNFVDLAGSERASQSLSAGTRLKEGCHINRSLLTLGTVIRKLSKEPNGHIPYRDSKLTRILQTSLGGNARTAIICTMSPAGSHVEQSRNTLLFATCAKEVTTNARVNVVMSEKALIEHLQKELERLESQMRVNQSNFGPPNYSALLREKDAQIEKLEKEVKDLIIQRDIARLQVKEVKDLIIQRDIARSQVQELVLMMENNSSSITQVTLEEHYPHLRVRKSPDSEKQEHDASSLADVYTSDHSRSSSRDHFARVPYFDDNIGHSDASPRILHRCSNSSGSDSFRAWDEFEKRSNGFSEDLCREVRCVERGRATHHNYSSSDEQSIRFPVVKARVNEDAQAASPPSVKYLGFMSSPLRGEKEGKKDQELEDGESTPSVIYKESDFSSLCYLDIASLGCNPLTPHHIVNLKLKRSKSCKAGFVATNSDSPWYKMMEFSDNTPSVGSENTVEFLSKKDCQSPLQHAVDIEIDEKVVKSSNAEKDTSSTSHMTEKTEREFTLKPVKENEPKVNESPKKNVKDVGLDPIEDENRHLTSWPVEFKRLRREIIELWHICNVSLVHRSYFYLLFQGDPSDAIYLQVEIRRMKFLKGKFSRGEKSIVNGQSLTLSSSSKALRRERRMLSDHMSKKFTEQEREILFVEWGIGLNTKLRRQQLAQLLWSKTEDTHHIAESAFLVAKLVGFIEPGQPPDKEMFGLNFTPKCSTGICTFKRSLISLL